MSLITYNGLVELVERGVIEGVKPEHINSASLDVTLGPIVWAEDSRGGIVYLAEKQTPAMRRYDLRDERSLLLHPGEFVLCQTAEIFHLPDDIACEFRLKSSGARAGLDQAMAVWCFTGDTRIPLLDGTVRPIEDLVGEEHWVYSLNADGDVVPGHVTAIWQTGEVSALVRVQLDSGTHFDCTPEHLIMLRNGTYKAAGDLVAGTDTLMPLERRITPDGYEQSYCPALVARSNWINAVGRWKHTHRLVAGAHSPIDGLVVHHKDGNQRNNHPSNLSLLEPGEHLAHHNITRDYSEQERERRSKTAIERNKRLWADDAFRKSMRKVASQNAISNNEKRWESSENREAASKWAKENVVHTSMRTWIANNKEEHRRRVYIGHVKKVVKELIVQGVPIAPETYTRYKHQSAPRVGSIIGMFGSFEAAIAAVEYRNHVVASVQALSLAAPIPVFDMTVDEYHNFAIEAGVFVHNCDPGFSNSVLTLELRNNLNFHTLELELGMKIGQLVFWKGEKVPSEKSYAQLGQYNNDREAQPSKGIR